MKTQAITHGKKASFWKRALAFLFDVIIITVISAVIFFFLDLGQNVADVIRLILFYAYNICFEYFGEGTVGKAVVNIKVIGIDERPPSLFHVIVRNFGKILSGIPFGLGFFMILAPHVRQTIHDKVGRCLVVER